MWERLLLNPKLLGVIIGLIVGLVVILAGTLDAFVLALFILAGFLIAKFWIGEIDFIDLYARFLHSRGKRQQQ